MKKQLLKIRKDEKHQSVFHKKVDMDDMLGIIDDYSYFSF